MSLFNLIVGSGKLEKAVAAIAAAETKRREATRQALLELNQKIMKALREKSITQTLSEVTDPIIEGALDEILKVTAQGRTVREVSKIAGPPIGEILDKFADKLEGKG